MLACLDLWLGDADVDGIDDGDGDGRGGSIEVQNYLNLSTPDRVRLLKSHLAVKRVQSLRADYELLDENTI